MPPAAICKRCNTRLVPHCPNNPRCSWRKCIGCQAVYEPKREHWWLPQRSEKT